jgi:hypothetical protein
MCNSARCPYERKDGSCKVKNRHYPADAMCMDEDKEELKDVEPD